MRFARSRDVGFACVLALTGTGCDRTPESSGTVTVVAAKTVAAAASSMAPAPVTMPPTPATPTPGYDVIVRGTAKPPADPNATPDVIYSRPRNFVDPPLPPELLDDGGLMPLPPGQAPSTPSTR